MARAHDESGSLRFSRGERARMMAALLLSLVVHFSAWSGYEAGKKHGWWEKIHAPAWLHRAAKQFPLQAQFAHNNEPVIFVDVSHADVDAPVRTKYYSNKNSRAANPDEASSNVPKISGTQTDVPKTEAVPRPVKPPDDVPKTDAAPKPVKPPEDTPKTEAAPHLSNLQPTMPPPQPKLAQPEPPETPGESDPPKPKKNPAAPPSIQPMPERPRTLKQALAQRDQLPGQQMQQAGGVARRATWSSLDAKATPFGEYDRAIVEAVSQRWYDLLDSRRFAQDRSGKVILRFKLKPDGTIIEMQTIENTVGELLGYLCHEAIEEAAPFAKWPPDMVRMIGANYREITFTFYYY